MFGLGSSASDRSFYDAFAQHSACIVEASELLVRLFREPEHIADLAQAVRDTEQAGDKITHETIARLHKTWITPIDRGHIHGLISAQDDVLDLIEAAAERCALYEITDPPEFVSELATVLGEAVANVHRAVQLLPQVKKPKEMLDLCIEINRLENLADTSYRRGLAQLFKGGHDAIAVMKWRDIIENLEAATDRCEDVANILEGIVLEYS